MKTLCAELQQARREGLTFKSGLKRQIVTKAARNLASIPEGVAGGLMLMQGPHGLRPLPWAAAAMALGALLLVIHSLLLEVHGEPAET